MATSMLEALVGAGRVGEAAAFLRQVTLAYPSPLLEPLRREVVQIAFRLGEVDRAQRLGTARADDLGVMRARIATAVMELAGEIEGVIGSDAACRQAEAFEALLRRDVPLSSSAAGEEVKVLSCGGDVFISYSHLDRDPALELTEKIQEFGVSVWLDDRITAGERYASSIVAAIDAARAVLVLWSPNAVMSDWVAYEARRAHSQGKHVPLLTGSLTVEDLPPPYPAVIHAVGAEHTEDVRAALRRLGLAV